MSMTSLGRDYISEHLYHNDNVHAALNSPDEVTDEHVRWYQEQGFLAVDNVFTHEQVAESKAGLDRLIRGEAPEFKGIQFEPGVDVTAMSVEERECVVRKIMWFVEYDVRLKAAAMNPVLVSLAQRLVGSEVRLMQDMALVKPPHIGREKPWHQDDAYFMYEPQDKIIGTWTALDHATPENGCMHVIPGSHLKGPLPHYHDRDCQLADEDVDVAKDVVVPLKPGGVLFFSGLMHHGTPPNRSASRRRALQYHYASIECRQTTPEQHAKYFYDAKGPAACMGMTPRKIAERF